MAPHAARRSSPATPVFTFLAGALVTLVALWLWFAWTGGLIPDLMQSLHLTPEVPSLPGTPDLPPPSLPSPPVH